MMTQLVADGFDGAIAPVNPRHEQIAGRRCYPSLADVPQPVDVALLGVPNRALEAAMTAASEASIPSVVIFASGHEESGDVPGLPERLSVIAQAAGMAVCGPNCMGFVNYDNNLRALAFNEPAGMGAGPITWLTHSGSAFSALLHNDRGLRFNLAVSTGEELTTTMADYMTYALERPSTKAIALFLETVRDPAAFRAALTAAAERDVPVVVLKVGKSNAARAAVSAHSGALAGRDAAFEALFETHGVMRVSTLNEMADTLELVAGGRPARPGGLAAILDSGGERAHLLDVGEEEGIAWAAIGEETRRRLEAVLEPGLVAANPLDAWGTGNDFEAIYLDCMRALLDDPATAGLAFVVDLAGEDPEWGYAALAEQVHGETELPMAVVSNLSSAIDAAAAASLREAGVPLLEDTRSGLAAFRHLFAYHEFRALPPLESPPPISEKVAARWRERLRGPAPWTEAEGLSLAADYGIPTVVSRSVEGFDEALVAAEEIGWPVALKVEGIAHKSTAGGVSLGIGSKEVLAAEHQRMAHLGDRFLVAEMAEPGVELALGLVFDEQFGPLVLVGAGGVMIESLATRCLALPPLDDPRAGRLLERLGRALPGGLPVDLAALSSALVRLSALACDLGEDIAALDLNPVIAGPQGCVAVDALVVPRLSESDPLNPQSRPATP